MGTKLNSLRLLDARKIPYIVTEYDAAREFHSAVEVAQLVGAPVESVYKTLVVVREPPKSGKPLLVMIAADRELDLKLLAQSLGTPKQKLRMATQREAEALTGLQVGGISALALLNRGFEIVLDERALALDKIHISAGARGVDVCLAVQDLIAVTKARVIQATSI
jgi:Cys-tRNA(Pro)/Cys-tRNA(Cys) deacylase